MKSYACSYMSDIGYIFGYMYSESIQNAVVRFLDLVKERDSDYDIVDRGGAISDDQRQAFCIGEHWCLQVEIVDSTWEAKRWTYHEKALVSGTGKSKG